MRTWRALAELSLPGVVSLATGLRWVFGERWASDGPYYQGIALKASREGFWWTLRESDVLYLNKPPIGFWMHALSAKVFGEGDWQARAPELACSVAICVLVGAMVRRWGGPAAGIIAGVIMACTWEWTRWIAFFRLDLHHTLFMLGAVVCLMRGHESDPQGRSWWRWTIGAGACVGLALLTKPLFALVAPMLVIAWLVLTRGLRDQASIGRGVRASAIAGAIGVAIALPWHVSMLTMHGSAFVDAYFVRQSLDRAIGARFRPEPWYWYVSYWFGQPHSPVRWQTWPILALALIGAIMTARRWWRLPAPRHTAPPEDRAWIALGVMALVWTLGWLGLMSTFADKRDYYMLVLYPGLAVLGGMGAARALQPAGANWVRRLAPIGLIVALVLSGYQLSQRDTIRQDAPLNAEIRALADWLSARRGEVVFNGGMRYNDAALVYIVSGVWPRTLVEKAPVPPEQLPAGVLAVYDLTPADVNAPERPKPVATDAVVYRSERFVVVRRGT